jgi:hypothetical protein
MQEFKQARPLLLTDLCKHDDVGIRLKQEIRDEVGALVLGPHIERHNAQESLAVFAGTRSGASNCEGKENQVVPRRPSPQPRPSSAL